MRASVHLTLAVVCYLLAVQYAHRMGSQNRIVDVGFRLTPDWHAYVPTVVLDVVPYALLLVLALDGLYHIYDYAAVIHGFASIMIWRALCNVATILPPAHEACSTEGDGLFWLHGGCHDMLFSGHLAYATFIAGVLVQQHPRWKPVLVGLVSVEFGLMIVARAHYSVDCILGCAIGWLYTHTVAF